MSRLTHGNSQITDELQSSERAHRLARRHVEKHSRKLVVNKDEGRGHWQPWRRRAADIITGKVVEGAMAIIIIFNLVLVIIETDENAKCYPKYKTGYCPFGSNEYPWLDHANIILLIIYSIEALVKLFIFRLEYFRSHGNQFDFLICSSGWASMLLDNLIRLSWLRVLRCFRIVKAFRSVADVKEIHALWVGFLGSMRAMIFGACMLSSMLVIFSIFIVQYVHPVNMEIDYGDCGRCRRGFRSVGDTILTLFQQIVAGDSWGTISIPIIEKDPIFGMILPFVQMVIGIGAMNLILAVIVDMAAEARSANERQVVEKRLEDMICRRLDLLDTVSSLDKDGDGFINRHEIEQASNNSDQFKNILLMAGLEYDELWDVVDCISDDEGRISYLRLCHVLDQIQESDIRITTVVGKMKIFHVSDLVQESTRAIQETLVAHEQMAKLNSQQLVRLSDKLDKFLVGRAEKCIGEEDLPSPLDHRAVSDVDSCRTSVAKDLACLQQRFNELDACKDALLQKAKSTLHSGNFDCLASRVENHVNYVMEESKNRRIQSLNNILQDLDFELTSLDLYCSLEKFGNHLSGDSCLSTPRVITPKISHVPWRAQETIKTPPGSAVNSKLGVEPGTKQQ